MAPYDIAQYLLDRANIHDTVVKVVRLLIPTPPSPMSLP
jgi:hypothetical protein